MKTASWASGLESLPKYFDEHRRALIETPIRIVVIIFVALIVRSLLRRSINKLVRPVSEGQVPRLLRPLKDVLPGQATHAMLGSAGLLSERRAQRAETIGSLLKSFVSLLVALITFMLVLSELDIDLAPLIAGTSIVGVALAFGAQNIVKDFLSGMFMIFEDQYGVGDVIDFEKATGTVESVGLRTTRLRDVNGTVWYVRNGEVVRVGNKSQGFAQVVLDVPIAAAADVARASAAILGVAREIQAEDAWSHLFLGEPEVQGVEAMTLEQTTIRMVVRVRPLEQWKVARELRLRIHERLITLGVDAGPPASPQGDETSAPASGAEPGSAPDAAPPIVPD